MHPYQFSGEWIGIPWEDAPAIRTLCYEQDRRHPCDPAIVRLIDTALAAYRGAEGRNGNTHGHIVLAVTSGQAARITHAARALGYLAQETT